MTIEIQPLSFWRCHFNDEHTHYERRVNLEMNFIRTIKPVRTIDRLGAQYIQISEISFVSSILTCLSETKQN
jgi:hypothetical protein